MSDPMTPTRGEANNNPGNINFDSETNWLGQQGIEGGPHPRFARFAQPVYGIRALAKNLLTYYRRYGLNTVDHIIPRWAPATDNNATGSYIRAVAQRTGFEPSEIIDLGDPATLGKLVEAIIWQENGRCIYPASVIAQAVGMALGSVPPAV